jgi:hypothetical protein
LDLENKNLYVIANKADLRSEDDLEDILDEIEESLGDYGIECEGISAYSANHCKEYSCRGISLNEFLTRENTKVGSKRKIITEINKVFAMYFNAINKDIEHTKSIRSKFNSLELDVLQAGYDLDETEFTSTLEEMKNSFSTNKLEKQLEDMKRIQVSMLSAVNDIFDGFLGKAGT